MCNYKSWCDIKKQLGQSENTAIPTYRLSKSGMSLTKLVKLCENGNLLVFEYQLYLTNCVTFMLRE